MTEDKLLALQPEPFSEVGSPAATDFRHQLSFKRVANRVLPHGYITLDMALDRLGRTQMGDTWASMLNLRPEFPFVYYPKSQKIKSYYVSGNKLSLKSKRFAEQDAGGTMMEASDNYRFIIHRFSAALQNKVVNAYTMNIDGEMIYIGETKVFTAQWRRVFYTGTLNITRDGKRRAVAIFLKEDQIENWLSGKIHRNHQPAGYRFFRPYLTLMSQRAAAQNYTFTRQELHNLLKDVVEDQSVKILQPKPVLTKLGFEKIWQEIGSKKNGAGPWKRDVKERFMKDRPMIIQMLLSEINQIKTD